jgi:predicted unusual protein kinase regulating ubiquinone biosynthesis (AarF/ABC1/UbiB family)
MLQAAMSDAKIPTGRVGRLMRLARVGARSGASLLVSKDGTAAAKQAAAVLGNLRGLAAKVGQMASYVDGMVPDKHREAYEIAMRSLRAAAPTSSPAAIRAVVEEELEAPIDRLFAEWEDEPFASASIGQVHRATLEDGLPVAVKVQHPGIDLAIETDLANAGLLAGMVGVVGPRNMNTKQVFAEIRSRFREELDYRLEAERQMSFAAIHAGDPVIHVPGIIGNRSAARVLTSELVAGTTLEEAAEAEEATRRSHAEALWRFVFKGNLVGGMFNADPHPGNYVFQADGRIAFLDFGCVQHISATNQKHARAMHVAALERDERTFAANTAKILETRGGDYEKAAITYTRACFRPLFEAPFHMTRRYVAGLVDDVMEMKRHMWAKDKSFVPLPASIIFMNRLQFGFYSVLARLDVEVDYARVERQFLMEAGLIAGAG